MPKTRSPLEPGERLKLEEAKTKLLVTLFQIYGKIGEDATRGGALMRNVDLAVFGALIVHDVTRDHFDIVPRD